MRRPPGPASPAPGDPRTATPAVRLPSAEEIARRTAVEALTRADWAREGHGTPDLDQAERPAWYQLAMFPYPSASGLHVGNMY